MLLVRYVALAALAIWVGGLVALSLVSAPSREVLRQFETLALVCGAVVFVSLIVWKFIGPPPADFFARIGLVAAMLAVALYAVFVRSASPAPATIDAAIGLALLSWYVRE